jgi:hypothetical protein
MRNANSNNVAKILRNEIFPRYGRNLLFISDHGKEFTARLLQNLMATFGQKHYLGLSYHPNSNAVERAHRTLINNIRADLLDKDQPKEKWLDSLPVALLNQRMALDESNSSPFERVFGLPNRSEISEIAPEPYHELEMEVPKIINETNDYLVVQQTIPDTNRKVVRTLHKSQNADYLVEHVNAVSHEPENEPIMSTSQSLPSLSQQEVAQAAKDNSAARIHDQNKRKIDKNSIPFCPLKNELVDKVLHQDKDSIDSRKFQRPYDGPYLVLSDQNYYKSTICSFNIKTHEKGKPIVCYSGQLRPTLALCKLSRRQWKIPWAPQ